MTKRYNKQKSIEKIQEGFNELVEHASPEFALGIIESVKMAYTLVIMRKIKDE